MENNHSKNDGFFSSKMVERLLSKIWVRVGACEHCYKIGGEHCKPKYKLETQPDFDYMHGPNTFK